MTEVATPQGEGSQGSASEGQSQADILAAIAGYRQEAESAKETATKSTTELERIKKALLGEEATKQSLLDRVRKAHQESEKADRGGIPLTMEMAEQLEAARQANAELQKKLDAIEKKSQMLSDPEVQHENQVYLALDQSLAKNIKTYYGGENPVIKNAVVNALNSEIADLKKNEPQTWKAIMQDPSLQEKMVQHFFLEAIPKQARTVLHDLAEKQKPFTSKDAQQALLEAKKVKDPGLREKAMKSARERYWEESLSEMKTRR